jgi:hypothetical protein
MADETKTVVVKEGVTFYSGMGLHPFKGGDKVVLDAAHADELIGHGLVEQHNPDAADAAKPEEETPPAPVEAE